MERGLVGVPTSAKHMHVVHFKNKNFGLTYDFSNF